MVEEGEQVVALLAEPPAQLFLRRCGVGAGMRLVLGAPSSRSALASRAWRMRATSAAGRRAISALSAMAPASSARSSRR
jgi:hypothetical protein